LGGCLWLKAVIHQRELEQLEAGLGTKRICPNCSERTVPVKRLLFTNYDCRECGAVVRAHWFYGMFFYILTFVVTLFSTLAILADQGLYAAILMFPLPIGAIGYLKARFCPLEARAT
jgi:hypothetical protein